MNGLAELGEDCDDVAFAELVREAADVDIGGVVPVIMPRCGGWLKRRLTLILDRDSEKCVPPLRRARAGSDVRFHGCCSSLLASVAAPRHSCHRAVLPVTRNREPVLQTPQLHARPVWRWNGR